MVTTRNMMSNDRHTLEEDENHQENPMVMIREMRREIEMLKRKNEEKVNTLKRKRRKK